MRNAVSGALATAMTLALTAMASAQSAPTPYFQQAPSGYQFGTIQPAATSTYQTPATAQPTLGNTLYPTSNAYAPQSGTTYAPQASATYAPPAPSTFAPAPTPAQAIPAQQQPVGAFSATTPSYASPYTPTTPQTYVSPSVGTAEAAYRPAPAQQGFPSPTYNSQIISQPLPASLPASASTRSVPANTAPSAANTANALQDTDRWSFNFARYYPAVQACLRKSTAKNPVIANIQQRDNQTMMLIGEGGSSSYSTCSTGLTGTTVTANSDIRTLPPAFFAPLGSTFTLAPDRPFQPIVDTDQKVIGWLVRTQPSRAVNQFGQAAGFDGQFIPPMMVNTQVGKS